MAAGLASAGANLMLVSRHQDEADAAAKSLVEDYGVKAIGFQADVTDSDQTEAMVARAMEQFGRLDILVNSAGINIRGPIDSLTPDEFKQVMDINVNGTWLACRAVTPIMKKAQYGRIINLASALGIGWCC
jgi:NAD(P)-dependent dehydrogenase (short-subunit alcohol dehydrogenase family)